MNHNSDEYFALSAQESQNSRAMIARWLGWLALGALVISTGVHAVSLVINQVGITGGIMSVIRVISPVLVEIIAAIVAIGFASHAWRGSQKLLGISVEVLWVAFAALNLLTSFAIESGDELPALLYNWLHYGLPLSALAAGALFYVQLRVDPEHRRQAEIQATAEVHKMADFSSQQSVLLSPQMQSVRKQQGWLKVISGLESQGYTAQQIDFLLLGVPGLQAVAATQLTHGNKKKTITHEPQRVAQTNGNVAYANQTTSPQSATIIPKEDDGNDSISYQDFHQYMGNGDGKDNHPIQQA